MAAGLNRPRRVAAALAVALALAATPLLAAERHDQALWTMVERAAVLADTLASTPAEGDSAELRAPLRRLEALRLEIARDPTVHELARASAGRTAAAHEAQRRMRDDADQLRQWWHGGGRERARQALSSVGFRRTDAAFEAYSDARQEEAIAEITRRLDRLEVKYGEGAPRLNLLEIAINYGFQGSSWLPWFRPSDAGPSPNEVVAAYSTSYFTIADDQARAVSVFELGWRRFNFGWRPESGNGVLAWPPRYMTYGVMISEQELGALRWPFSGVGEGKTRVGPFLSYGEIKAAVLFYGSEKQFIVSRQLHLLPHLF
jgi:hypothetical protein